MRHPIVTVYIETPYITMYIETPYITVYIETPYITMYIETPYITMYIETPYIIMYIVTPYIIVYIDTPYITMYIETTYIWPTVVEGDWKGNFSIATIPRCKGRHYSFPWLLHLPLIRTLQYWVLSKGLSSTIFESLVWLDQGIEPPSPGPLANTLTTISMGQLYIPNRLIGLVGRVFTSVPGAWVHVIPKSLKMVLDGSLLNTQQYKVRIKGKVEQSRETCSVLLCNSALWRLKRKPSSRPLLRSLTLLYLYIPIYI